MTTTREAALEAALQMFIAETVDYMTRNNLGDPEKQHTVKQARAALSTPATEPQGYVEGLGLKRIVEEIDGAIKHGTWRDEHGMRLKDTPEWVAFYNSLAARPASPDTRVVDWQQLEAVAHALSVADAKCDPEVIHKLEAQARAIIGGQDRG